MNTDFDRLARHTEGRKTHIRYMNTHNTDVQTDNMYIVRTMRLADGFCSN